MKLHEIFRLCEGKVKLHLCDGSVAFEYYNNKGMYTYFYLSTEKEICDFNDFNKLTKEYEINN